MMGLQSSREAVLAWCGKRVLVVGDVMLDRYIWGDVSRISPEAPVPILLQKSEQYLPGGAANVAANITALGGEAQLAGVIGDDPAGTILAETLERSGISAAGLVRVPGQSTTEKIRLMGGRQQLLRVDRERDVAIAEHALAALLASMSRLAEKVHAVVVSDYAKGVVSESLMEVLRELARRHGIALVVDGKPVNEELFHDVTVLTPNLREACEMAAMEARDDAGLAAVGERLCARFQSSALITMGERGMALFERGRPMTCIAARAREVFDVAGAGDTVAAAVALGLAAGHSMETSARLANAAAGIVVAKVGTATATAEELAALDFDEA